MYRSRELRLLSAVDFYQMYEVRKLVQDGDPSSRVQQGSAFDPQGRAGTRGRKCQTQYRFMARHPLSETHVCVRRSKLPMWVPCGGTGPRRPDSEAALCKFETWAAYYSALFIPWGNEDTYPVQRHMNPAPVQKHFAPAITVGEFEQWRLALSTHSLEPNVLPQLERRPDQLPVDLRRPSRTVACSLYAERTCEVGDRLRDVSRRSSGRSCVPGDDELETKKLRRIMPLSGAPIAASRGCG
jgi:hypothetical protein